MHFPLYFLGYAYGKAAGDPGCADGPQDFQQSNWFKKLVQAQPNTLWDTTFYDTSTEFQDKYLATEAICQNLGIKTYALTKANQSFIVIGGDHSSAIGTWSGVHQALAPQGPLGLIWIDAHLDSHTPETTPSGNIHGMPLAALLGYGDPRLTHLIDPTPKLSPEHLCLIGIRSFEPGEADLLESLGVRIFYMSEVNQRGLTTVFTEALSIVQKNTAGFGLSIDLDALDPQEAPGVGTPEANGLNVEALCEVLTTLSQNQKFLGAEITEFNPHHDENHKTEEVIYRLICAMNNM